MIYEDEWQRCEVKIEDRFAAAEVAVEMRQSTVVDVGNTAGEVASDAEDSEEVWYYAYEEADVGDNDTSLVERTEVDIEASWGAWRVGNMAGRRGEGACSGGCWYMSHRAAEREAASASDVACTGDDDFAAY